MVEKEINVKRSDNKYKYKSRTLVNIDLYLKNGIHIGTKYKNGPMRRFIFKSRNDKLNVMDVQAIDQRIKIGIDFLLRYDPKDVIFISRKKYGLPGLKVLEKTFGYKSIVNRFIPGTFTNPQREGFTEPKLVFICDPNIDRQAIVEATKICVPVMALATTSSNIRNIDLVLPFNNKGRKAISLFFWLLNRELQLRNGIIKSEQEYSYSVEDFLFKVDKKDSKGKGNFNRDSRSSGRFGNSRFGRTNNYRSNTSTNTNPRPKNL